MDLIQNKYQLSKTLRFGLTLKQKTKKKNYIGDVYESHTELKDLVKFSEDKIKFEIKHSSDANIPVEDIKKSLDWINKFLEAWEKIYHRTDQLALEKDYYKKLSRKIGFQGFWYYKKDNELVKRPQSREIKLSELVREDEHGKKRNTYIIEFWSNIIQKAKEKLYETEAIFEKFESAIKSNRDDDRPNEVEMRKMFISLANIINEVLLPLCNNSISFPNIEKLINNEESKILREFALDDEFRMNLLNLLEELKIYFSENGGNVPYCRATLNPMTGIKKPELTDNSINKEVDLTGIEKYLQSNTQHIDKFKAIQDESLPLIERGLLFKYKTIPAVVQFDLAKVLAEKTGKSLNEMRTIIRTIGLPQSPAKDYADMQDKSEFNIHNYPLKVAFDYAWENLAKAVYHPDLDFPKQQCEKFLKDIFGVVTDNNADFKLYSQLLYLRELLAALEHGKPADVKSIVEKAQQLLEEIKWNDVSYNKGAGYKKAISDWLKTRSKNDEKFQKAKQQVGLIRGGLKNKIKRFKTLTEAYKDIAMKLGKAFADMRDKITGAVELNKISHYATIIEDRNNDKYVLIEKLIVGENPSILGYFDEEGELITYSVNSVTSAAINKMIRKIRAGELQKNENNKQQSDTISDERREAENLLRWKKFIESKQWDREFNIDMNINELEQLKREIDTKCYKLESWKISKQTLEDLVKNKDCLLFPIINQDLVREDKTARNQFTKDWVKIFSENPDGWRLTPEFRISYRKPTANYPNPDGKRYSRFQLIAHFVVDFIPQNHSYVSVREQIATFKDNDKQKEAVEKFHDQLNSKSEEEQHAESVSALQAKFAESKSNKLKHEKDEKKKKDKFYVFGIDRGQNELATLCVINQDKKIIGDFEIYTRVFNADKKQWEHTFLEKRHILDLSNLRVETARVIDGKNEKRKVLVDLSEVKVKDKNGGYTQPDKMQIKMRHLAYIRKLQFQMQFNPDAVMDYLNKYSNKDDALANLVHKQTGEQGLISWYGAGNTEEDLPRQQLWDMLEKFKELKNKPDDLKAQKELKELIELEPVDNLKYGVVANMVGVIAHLMEKFNYQVYISVEDLSKDHGRIISGLRGVSESYIGEGKRAEVEKYAGLGLYNFFEMQLLKKLFRIQNENGNVLHLVPAFRAVKNYEHIVAGKDKIKGQFGIVYFVDATSTSKTCPVCESTPENNTRENRKKKNEEVAFVKRDKSDGIDNLKCFVCGFDTSKEYTENPLCYIKSGDDNAAYIIATCGLKAYELAKIVVDEKN